MYIVLAYLYGQKHIFFTASKNLERVTNAHDHKI